MNLWNYGKVKIKTTNVNVSFCMCCALLIEYHTGTVLLSHNFYAIQGQLDTAIQ